MSNSALLLAAAMLLFAPGPTNALFAAAGAAGPRTSWPGLIAAGLVSYLLAIALLSATLSASIAAQPSLGAALQGLAAAYLAFSAVGLLRCPAAGSNRPVVTAARMFVTTFLNPKAIIFAFGLLPGLDLMIAAGGFACGFLLAACTWLLIGAGASHHAPQLLSRTHVSRATAAANLLFATILGGSALHAIG